MNTGAAAAPAARTRSQGCAVRSPARIRPVAPAVNRFVSGLVRWAYVVSRHPPHRRRHRPQRRHRRSDARKNPEPHDMITTTGVHGVQLEAGTTLQRARPGAVRLRAPAFR